MALSSTPFKVPVGSPYTFSKVVQFNPRGEARLNNSVSSYPPQPAAEIGIVPTHGTTVVDINGNSVNPNLNLVVNRFAIQFGGVGGNVIIYRQ
jgi:hypothetical protein